MSAQEIITEHIDLWTSSIKAKKTQGRGSSKKRELYGIKKLRELILELAVHGKLVPQDPNDEPASVLLERIAAEKAQLIKDKMIKKPKPLPAITEEEKPFDLPAGWEWTQLGKISEISPRNKLEDDLEVSFVPMPMIKTSYKGDHEQEVKLWKEIKKGYTHFAEGDIGLAKITPCFENSKAAVFKSLKNGFGAGTTELHIARLIGNTIDPLFILLYLKAPMFLEKGKSKMTGTAGQKRVPNDFFSGNPLPLAPQKEQHRIVAKVDELMALCDQLERQTESSLDAHNLLVDTLLSTLTDALDAKEISDNWARLAQHFDTLITTDYAVEQLKQTILQLAVQGKLAPQDPNDEPASVLLERIAAEKAQLIKDKMIKKPKPLPAITEEEKPFYSPKGWSFCYLRDIMNVLNGRAYKKHEMLKGGTPLLRVGNLFTSKEWYYSDLELEPEKYIDNGDLIYAWSASFGPFIWSGGKAIYHYHIWKLDQYHEPSTNKFYLLNYLQAITARIKASGHGIAMIHMTKEKMEKLVLPIAPLAEQHRIVAKVDELMALCDQLEVRLKDAQSIKLQLADTVAEQELN